MSPTDAPAPTDIDWDAIEPVYRRGVVPLRTLAAEHGISEGAIRKHAKVFGWERDLQAKVSAKADALVRKAEVRKQVRHLRTMTERAEIEAAAIQQAAIITAQQETATRARQLLASQLTALEALAADPEEYRRLGDLLRSADSTPDKLREAYDRVIALPGQVDTSRKLMSAIEQAINVERRVYRIREDDAPAGLIQIAEIRLIGVVPRGNTYEHEA